MYAMEGTAAHFALERTLQGEPLELGTMIYLDQDEDCFLEEPDDCKFQTPVTQEMLDAIDEVTEYIERKEPSYIISEQFVNPLPGCDDTGGRGDVIMVHGDETTLEVIDFKYGMGIWVDVRGNPQTRSYLLGAAQHPDIAGLFPGINRFVHTIIIPRHRDYRGPQDEWMLHEQLMKFADELRKGVERVHEAMTTVQFGNLHEYNEQGYLQAGEKHCYFCPHKLACPAWSEEMGRLAAADFDDMPPEDPNDNGLVVPWEPRQIERIMLWAPAIRNWLKQVEIRGMELLELDPECMPSFTIGERRTNRKWTDWEDDIPAVLREKYGLTDEQIYESKMRTGPQIEKLIPKERRGEFNADLLVKPPGGPTIQQVK